jgi:hypothetical protein
MYVCILDSSGEILVHRNGPASPEHFLAVIRPYREDVVVSVECMFTWYWLADLCSREGIPFVLGHALYMKAIHGGKAKNDKIDAHKIAALLRGGLIPMAYAYPAEMRATRDLLRRRCHLMQKRAELLTHIQNTASQYNLPTFGKKIAYKGNRTRVAEHFPDPAVRKSIEMDLALIDRYEEILLARAHARSPTPQRAFRSPPPCSRLSIFSKLWVPPFEKGGSGGILGSEYSDKSPSIPLFQRGRPASIGVDGENRQSPRAGGTRAAIH